MTGLLCRIPIPGPMRGWTYGAFSRRYGVELDEVSGELRDYRSLQQFFGRSLKDGARPVAAEAATKYFVLGAISSACLLYGISLLYGITGSVLIVDIAAALGDGGANDTATLLGIIFLVVGIGFKFLDVQAVGTRKQPPVDATHIVAGHVGAMFGKVHRHAEHR